MLGPVGLVDGENLERCRNEHGWYYWMDIISCKLCVCVSIPVDSKRVMSHMLFCAVHSSKPI